MRKKKRYCYELDAAFDEPSKKDFDDVLFGGIEDLPPSKQIGKGIIVQDQGLSLDTSMACGSFMAGHDSNAMNKQEHSITMIRCHDHWEEFIKAYQDTERYTGIQIRTQGSYLQDQIEFLRKKDYITGYYQVTDKDSMRKALAAGRTIATGSKKISRKETRKKPYVAVEGSGAAHMFGIVGYNDLTSLFICINSYGTDSYDKGYFYLKYDDVDLLYTRYALIDKKDSKANLVLLQMKAAKIVLQLSDGNPLQEDWDTYGEILQRWLDRGTRHKI